jgi:hypothetical protein
MTGAAMTRPAKMVEIKRINLFLFKYLATVVGVDPSCYPTILGYGFAQLLYLPFEYVVRKGGGHFTVSGRCECENEPRGHPTMHIRGRGLGTWCFYSTARHKPHPHSPNSAKGTAPSVQSQHGSLQAIADPGSLPAFPYRLRPCTQHTFYHIWHSRGIVWP